MLRPRSRDKSPAPRSLSLSKGREGASRRFDKLSDRAMLTSTGRHRCPRTNTVATSRHAERGHTGAPHLPTANTAERARWLL